MTGENNTMYFHMFNQMPQDLSDTEASLWLTVLSIEKFTANTAICYVDNEQEVEH